MKLYRIYLFFYRRFQRLKPKGSSVILHIFTQKNIAHIAIVFTAIMVATSSIQAYEISDDEFMGSLLYVLTDHEELGYLVEEKVDFQSDLQNANYFSAGKLTKSDSPLTQETSEEAQPESVLLTQGGTALVKPNISSDEELVRRADESYVVQTGDTISTIAERYGLSVSTILWANKLTSRSYIKPGQTLAIPPGNGVYHSIKRGENISVIAARYDISPEDIVEFNELDSAENIVGGQKLFIPNGKQISEPPRVSPVQSIKRIFTPDTTPSVARGDYIWPTTCRTITQYYGWKHTGVDIACGMGQAVYATRGGTVTKSAYGWNGGYGNVIIVDHGDGVQSLYAHNTENYVSVGDTVSQGDVIAAMGSTGRSTGPHTHFEIHLGGRRTNPMSYIR